jgi:hypothetical protein
MQQGNRKTKRCTVVGAVLALICGMCVSLEAQRRPERPEVHADFGVGVFPWSADAVARFESDEVRLLISGLHRGWSVDKVIEETESPRVRIFTATDELEDAGLVRGRNDYDMRPGFPVLREEDVAEADSLLDLHAAEFVRIIEEHWEQIEDFAASLEAGQEFPDSQTMYRIVVGGVLLGGMIDALFEDQTLMPNPPRRGRRGVAYYVWMVEGATDDAYLVLRSDRVGRHEVFSVGPVADLDLRVQLDELAQDGPVYEAADARSWRVFTSTFSRDYLLPYLKSQRDGLRQVHSEIEASKYSAFGEFMAWYYQALICQVADSLDTLGLIETPETSFRYALRERR